VLFSFGLLRLLSRLRFYVVTFVCCYVTYVVCVLFVCPRCWLLRSFGYCCVYVVPLNSLLRSFLRLSTRLLFTRTFVCVFVLPLRLYDFTLHLRWLFAVRLRCLRSFRLRSLLRLLRLHCSERCLRSAPFALLRFRCLRSHVDLRVFIHSLLTFSRALVALYSVVCCSYRSLPRLLLFHVTCPLFIVCIVVTCLPLYSYTFLADFVGCCTFVVVVFAYIRSPVYSFYVRCYTRYTRLFHTRLFIPVVHVYGSCCCPRSFTTFALQLRCSFRCLRLFVRPVPVALLRLLLHVSDVMLPAHIPPTLSVTFVPLIPVLLVTRLNRCCCYTFVVDLRSHYTYFVYVVDVCYAFVVRLFGYLHVTVTLVHGPGKVRSFPRYVTGPHVCTRYVWITFVVTVTFRLRLFILRDTFPGLRLHVRLDTFTFCWSRCVPFVVYAFVVVPLRLPHAVSRVYISVCGSVVRALCALFWLRLRVYVYAFTFTRFTLDVYVPRLRCCTRLFVYARSFTLFTLLRSFSFAFAFTLFTPSCGSFTFGVYARYICVYVTLWFGCRLVTRSRYAFLCVWLLLFVPSFIFPFVGYGRCSHAHTLLPTFVRILLFRLLRLLTPFRGCLPFSVVLRLITFTTVVRLLLLRSHRSLWLRSFCWFAVWLVTFVVWLHIPFTYGFTVTLVTSVYHSVAFGFVYVALRLRSLLAFGLRLLRWFTSLVYTFVGHLKVWFACC